MKIQRVRLLSYAVSLLTLGMAQPLLAVDGKWTSNASANWWDSTRWTNAQVADGIGARALIEANFSAARTITVNGPVTLGNFRYNDTTSTYYDMTLASSGGSLLTLQASTGIPIIDINRQTVTFNSTLLLAGSQGFVKIGGGSLTLANTGNNNTLLGNIIVGAGTLTLNNAYMSNMFSGKYVVTNGVLRATSEPCLGVLPTSPVADLVTVKTGGYLMNNSSDLVLGANIGITVDASGGGIQAGWSRDLTVNGPISGSGTLTFRNDTTPGRISLNGVNTFSGPIFVGHGISGNWCWLEVNSTLAGSSLTVRTNGSLGGVGTVNAPVTVLTNGILSPGPLQAAGTLTINNNATLTNAFLNFDLANVTTPGAGVNDLLQVNGNLTMSGTITISVNPLNGALTPGTYRLINYTGTLDVSTATLVCDNPRYSATFDTSTPQQINVTIVNVTPANLVWAGTAGTNWDVGISANFLNGSAPDFFYQGDAVKFDDTGIYDPAGVYEVAPTSTLGALWPRAVVVDSTNDFTLTSSGIAGRLGGPMSLYKGGTGTFTFANGNGNQPNTYTGITLVTNGVLKLGANRVLGATNAESGTIVTNLGQVDINGQYPIYEPFTTQGDGPDGTGAIVNTGAARVNDGLRGDVIFAGDTTLGGPNRFDLNLGRLFGNGYKLTKAGANEIALENLGDIGIGEGLVTAGTLTFLGNTTPGLADKPITVVSNATLNFWAISNAFNKPLVLNNGNLRNGSGLSTNVGTITLEGTNGLNAAALEQFTISGPIIGTGGLRKLSANTAVLEGANTYTGPTFIDAGTLTLASSASLASSLIAVTNGAIFDVSQQTAFTLNSSQTLSGSGQVYGNVTLGSGATLVPGSSPGTLTFLGALTLNNSRSIFELGSDPNAGTSDFVEAGGGLALIGVNRIQIQPLGPLSTTAPYTLFHTGLPLPSGSEANFAIDTASRYSFSVLPTDTGGGYYVQVQVSGSGSAATLTWAGNDAVNPTWWDTKVTTNWLNSGSPDKFFLGDNTIFDDTAVATTVEFQGAVQPSLVQMRNVGKTIRFSGAGSLVSGAFTADTTGTTLFENTAANSVVFGLTNNLANLVFGNLGGNTFGSGLANGGNMLFTNAGANVFSGGLAFNNANATFANGGVNNFGGGLFINGGTVRLQNPFANSVLSGGSVNFGYGTLASALVFEQAINTTFSAPISGGPGQVVKAGTNVLTLSGGNSSYYGDVVVESGTLKAGNAACLGDTTGGTLVKSGATLDVNALNLGNEVITVSGSGVDDLGAIINTGGGQNNALHDVVLTGDVVFGGTGRWDVRTNDSGPATFSTSGHAYNITKIGNNQVSLVSAIIDSAIANVDIQAGIFGYETSNTGLGDPNYTLTVRSNARVQLWNIFNPLDKKIVLENSSTFGAGSGATNTIIGPVTLVEGTVKFQTDPSAVVMFMNGPISGDGGLTKLLAGTVVLGGSNTIGGSVSCSAGTLTIASNTTIAGDLFNNGGTTLLASSNWVSGTVSNLSGTMALSNVFGAVAPDKTFHVRYGTATGGNGTRLGLRGGLTMGADFTAEFLATNLNGSSYRCSITSDWLTNTWQGPILLNGNDIVGFYATGPTNWLNITGPVVSTNGFTGTAFFRGTGGRCGDVSGQVYMPDGIVAITDNAAWLFTHPSNIWSKTSIAYGTFMLGTNDAACPTALLTMGQNSSVGGWLDLNGFNQTVPAIQTINTNNFITNGSPTADSVLTYDGTTNTSVLTKCNVVDGARKLSLVVKSGSLTLPEINTYKGDTIIMSGATLGLGTAGTLASPLIDVQAGGTFDTSAQSPPTAVVSGQTVKGNGTVNGSLTIASGGTLSAGASVGTLTVTNALVFVAGATNVAEVNKSATPACDRVNAASITYGGTLVVNNLGPALALGDSFKLFEAQSYAGAFAAISPATPGTGLAWDTNNLAVNGTLAVKAGVVIPTTPTNMTVVVTGNTLDLSWPSDYTGWLLESQTNALNIGVSTNWFTVPGSAATNRVIMSIDPATGTVFFRMVHPQPQ